MRYAVSDYPSLGETHAHPTNADCCFKGYQGYQGHQGHQGYQGYQGHQGYQGYQGKSRLPGASEVIKVKSCIAGNALREYWFTVLTLAKRTQDAKKIMATHYCLRTQCLAWVTKVIKVTKDIKVIKATKDTEERVIKVIKDTKDTKGSKGIRPLIAGTAYTMAVSHILSTMKIMQLLLKQFVMLFQALGYMEMQPLVRVIRDTKVTKVTKGIKEDQPRVGFV